MSVARFTIAALCVCFATVTAAGEDITYDVDYMSDWPGDWSAGGGRTQTPKCIDIPANLTLCRNIGYTEMRLPNLLDHDTVGEASQQAKSWVSLINIGCHPDTQLFLCSLFSPICLNRPIWPCRTLCEDVKRGCEGRMLKYGFPWPEMLRCDKFPLDNDLCIGLQNHVKPDNSMCDACKQPATVEAIIDHFCNSEFAMKIQIRKTTRRRGGEIRLKPAKKRRIFKKGSLSKRELRKGNLVIQGADNCQCESIATGASQPNNVFHLAMGRKIGDKLVLSFVRVFDKNNKHFRKAVRTMRTNERICRGGVAALTVGGSGEESAKAARRRDRNSRRATKKTGGGRKNRGRVARARRRHNHKQHKSKHDD